VTSDTTDGGVLTVNKPARATVRKAYLAVATTGFPNSPLTEPLQLDGRPVALDNDVASGIGSHNYFMDVTAAVKPKLDAAAAGPVQHRIVEPSPP
jgi:hypothetical protein